MDLIRDWLIGVTGASILTALAIELMPGGPVQTVGKLVCGLVLLLAILKPLNALNQGVSALKVWNNRASHHSYEALQSESDKLMEHIIEDRFEAYVIERASEMELNPGIRIECSKGTDEIYLPESAIVTGLNEKAEQEKMLAILHADLGIRKEAIRFEEVPVK